jgi:uncharacterized protein YecE (DUF72 family)
MSQDSKEQLGLFGDEPPPERGRGRRKVVHPAQAASSLLGLAGGLPRQIRLGTSSWSFPGWAGLVYDGECSEQILAKRGFSAYAAHPLFGTIGIDRTYYRPVDAATFESYAADAGENFRFLVKAHDHVTIPRFPSHPRYGAKKGERNERFLDAAYARDAVVAPFVEGLGERGGPLLFQFSPLGVRDEREAGRFAERVHAFVSALPKGPLYAFEVRDAAIPGKPWFDALRSAGAVHCANVHPTMPSVAEQFRMAGEAMRRAVVVRWMLGGSLGFEEARNRYAPFNRLVDEDTTTRTQIADAAVDAAVADVPVYVIANNKAEGSAPLTLAALARSIVERPSR